MGAGFGVVPAAQADDQVRLGVVVSVEGPDIVERDGLEALDRPLLEVFVRSAREDELVEHLLAELLVL
jgi:hypothetical protein